MNLGVKVTAAILLILAMRAIATGPQASGGGKVAVEPLGKPLKMLSRAGIKSADDIESVIVRYPSATYKVNRKDHTKLVRRIYDGLESAYRAGPFSAPWASPLILRLHDGRAIWLDFCDEESQLPGTIFISEQYLAPGLLSPLLEIKWSEQAAALDARNISFRKFACDRIAVLDYGNYRPPLVAFGLKLPSGTYYLCPYPSRREQEKYGVEKLGFSGHPVSDTEYYKSPAVLYKELQELTRAACDEWQRKQEGGS